VTEDPKHDRYHLIDVLAAGTRAYLLISVGPKGHEASTDAKRFRDSFNLIAPRKIFPDYPDRSAALGRISAIVCAVGAR